MSVGVVVGNPKAQSRTLGAATRLAQELGGCEPNPVVDVVAIGPAILGSGGSDRAALDAALSSIKASSVVVFASPTFKATYTGVLKLFLDQFGAGELAGVVAVPMMVGGAPQHAMAPEVFLRPLLVELGASCPTRAVYVLEESLGEEDLFVPWLDAEREKVLAMGASMTKQN